MEKIQEGIESLDLILEEKNRWTKKGVEVVEKYKNTRRKELVD